MAGIHLRRCGRGWGPIIRVIRKIAGHADLKPYSRWRLARASQILLRLIPLALWRGLALALRAQMGSLTVDFLRYSKREKQKSRC